MKILLDTHVLLWLLEDNPRLASRARQLIDDKENELCFSSISIAEIAIKHRKNPQLMPPTPDEVRRFAIASDIGELNFTSGHAIALADLPLHHRDPFDRMLLAQAKGFGMKILSHDDRFPAYGDFVIAV